MRKAICPGSFDPVTLGHLDIISRSAKLFDKVYVAVLKNSEKKPLFTVEERIDLLRRCLTDHANVEVVTFSGLLVDCAKTYGAAAIVKGLRAVTDFEYELQMSQTNMVLNSDIDTIFFTTSLEILILKRSATRIPFSIVASGNKTTNSSPPKRATISDSRKVLRQQSANACKTISPTACPCVSLTFLE